MTQDMIERAIVHLTEKEPDMGELRELYWELQSSQSNSVTVEKHAMEAVVSSLVDYLDFVGTELEKSIGLRRGEERLRILNELSYPDEPTTYQQIERLIEQWEQVELYSQKDIEQLVSQ